MQHIWTIYGALIGINSLVVAVLLAWDKRQADRDGWRVPEKRLHTLEALGGWPGSWLARRYLRHKTRKRKYRVTYAFIVAWHLAILLILLAMDLNPLG